MFTKKEGFTPVKYKQSLPSNDNRNFTGFTLIELMVVIVIIAVLSTVALVYLRSARDAAEDSARMSAVTQLRSLAYLGFEKEEIDVNDLSTIRGDLGEIICRYGNPEDAYKGGCESEGVLIIEFDLEEKQFCAAIELNEIGEDNQNKYFCIDRSLVAEKYLGSEQACGDNGNPACTN